MPRDNARVVFTPSPCRRRGPESISTSGSNSPNSQTWHRLANGVELSILRPRMESAQNFRLAGTGAIRAAILKEKFSFPFVSRPDTFCQWRSIGVSPALHVDASSALLQPAPDLAFSQWIDHHPPPHPRMLPVHSIPYLFIFPITSALSPTPADPCSSHGARQRRGAPAGEAHGGMAVRGGGCSPRSDER